MRYTPRRTGSIALGGGRVAEQADAAELGTSEITIGAHRGQVMRKMGAAILAESVRMADKLAARGKVMLWRRRSVLNTHAEFAHSLVNLPRIGAAVAKDQAAPAGDFK